MFCGHCTTTVPHTSHYMLQKSRLGDHRTRPAAPLCRRPLRTLSVRSAYGTARHRYSTSRYAHREHGSPQMEICTRSRVRPRNPRRGGRRERLPARPGRMSCCWRTLRSAQGAARRRHGERACGHGEHGWHGIAIRGERGLGGGWEVGGGQRVYLKISGNLGTVSSGGLRGVWQNKSGRD